MISISTIILGLITLANNPRQYTNRAFAALSFACGLYTLANFLVNHDDPSRALIWVRSTFVIATWMVLFVMLFITSFPRRALAPRYGRIGIIIAIFVAALAATPLFIADAAVQSTGVGVSYGTLYPLFLAYLTTYFGIAIFLSVRMYRHSDRLDKQRLRFIAWGFAITAALLIVADIILPLIQGAAIYAEVGAYSILIFTAFCSYAIVRHRLFNIRVLVARSLAYILLIGTMAFGYSVVAFRIGNAIFGDQGGVTSIVHEAYNTVLVLVLAFTFQPLRRFFQRLTNRLFYRNSYDSQDVLNKFSQVLVSEFEIDSLLKHAQVQLCHALHVQYSQIVVFHDNKIYREQHFGVQGGRSVPEHELRVLDAPILVADELQGGRHKSVLDSHGIRVSLSLRTDAGFVGYLLLGDKLSGEIYSDQDIELLEIAGKGLAVAISNARAYAEIKAFNVTLAEEVKDATSQLRASNSKLRKLDEAKDEFISMASHQLRTPLTGVKGYLSMALEGDAGKLNESQRKLLEEAFMSAQRMVYLIGDFLNVSRIQTGKFVLELKPINLAVLVQEEINQLLTTAERRHIKLEYHQPSHFPALTLDEDKIRQVVMNFTDNAIYYSKPDSTVNIELIATATDVQLKVRDTGIGVPENERHHLFTKFYRAANARQVRPDGTGVGLFMAKKVVTAHGGSIIFESQVGKGSTFGFSMPLKAVHISEDKAEELKDQPANNQSTTTHQGK